MFINIYVKLNQKLMYILTLFSENVGLTQGLASNANLLLLIIICILSVQPNSNIIF